MNHVQSRNSKYTENKPSKTQTFSITFQVINGISCTVAKKNPTLLVRLRAQMQIFPSKLGIEKLSQNQALISF